MTKELAFWVIYLISLVVGIWSNYDPTPGSVWYRRASGSLALWILVAILGWAMFGAPIK